jgi:putative oxidoreductase
MKIVVLISRLLLGLVFLVFGANGLHQFLPQPQMPPGLAGQYISAIAESHYALVPFSVQFIGGLLLLINRYVPLALTILGPVLVNILSFHIFMYPTGLPPALVVTLLWFILFYNYRRSFAGIFQQRPPAPTI